MKLILEIVGAAILIFWLVSAVIFVWGIWTAPHIPDDTKMPHHGRWPWEDGR